MILVKLTTLADESVYVNPEHVVMVQPRPAGLMLTDVYLVGGRTVVARGSATQISHELTAVPE